MGMDNIANLGMQAAMENMSIISNNIANANTYAFKRSTGNFADLFPTGNDTAGVGIGSGVQLTSTQIDFTPGGPSNPTFISSDISLNNAGFFIMKDPNTGQSTYSRYGRFSFDAVNGFFTIGSSRLQGFPAVNGGIPAGSTPSDLQVNTDVISGDATTTVTQSQLNLNSADKPPTLTPFDPTNASTYNFTTATTIYDSLGSQHSLSVYYVNTGPGAWTVNSFVDGASVGAPGSMTFDTNGNLTATSGLSNLSFLPGTGAASPQTFSINLTGATQFGSPDFSNPFTRDGFPAGRFTSFTIDQNGKVSANYNNGQPATLVGQIAIANFQAPQGLQSLGNMSWSATTDSGTPIINQANSANNFSQGTVELSNVDLANELVNLISAQNTFSANAQVEQTFVQVMQKVMQI